MANGDRGTVRDIVLTIEYPDGTMKTARVKPSEVSRILLNATECKAAVAAGTWDTGDWRTNPAYVVIKPDGTAVASCSSTQHP